MSKKTYDFGGWATKNDLKCSDGRVIRKDAFKDNDGQTVPLVWNHQHNDPNNVLGHALLENRPEGVYAYGSFNNTEAGLVAKDLLLHGDITALSIYANHLKQEGHDVLHGAIREVSLVLAGANAGATIETVLLHADGSLSEGIIYPQIEDLDLDVEHTAILGSSGNSEETVAEEKIEEKPEEKPEEKVEEKKIPEEKPKSKKKEKEVVKHADDEEEDNEMAEKTVKDVFDTLNEEQKLVVYALVGQAIEDAKNEKDNEGEEKEMKHNVFDGNDEERQENVLSHSDMEAIFSDAKRYGSLKESVLQHGITDIEYLFPDAKTQSGVPEFIKRDDEWVSKVMNNVHHTPFSRLKSVFADITEADARAKGYIKGNRKIEEVFGLLKRTTSPTTIYKKQKLDRDDVTDIVDFDVVGWLKSEMRSMLNEEIARAILVGDGRNASSDDKINEQCIRPIWTDDDLYTIKKTINVSSSSTEDMIAKAFIRAAVKSRKEYKGKGNPDLYTTEDMLTNCLLMEDGMGRIIYDSVEKLATALRVRSIVTVPVMENLSRVVDGETLDLAGIIVNLDDYNVGADKGGAVSMFEDFDIDYNAQKYLIETRCSGSLVKPFSAIAIELSHSLFQTVSPDDSSDLYGKAASELQDGIMIHDNFISGTLKYVTGYTGFSGDANEQSGNYLALKVAATDGSTTTVELVGGTVGHPVTLDSDMNIVIRVSNKYTQKVKVVTTKDGVSVSNTYSLSSLNCESAN